MLRPCSRQSGEATGRLPDIEAMQARHVEAGTVDCAIQLESAAARQTVQFVRSTSMATSSSSVTPVCQRDARALCGPRGEHAPVRSGAAQQ